MKNFETVKAIQKFITSEKSKGKSIGFVPTMGALHAGHLSLIEQARTKTDVVVCSIFVNPTQFDNQEDLTKYPRTIETDRQLLIDYQTDVLFLPTVQEIYPNGMEPTEEYDFGYLDQPMEGAFRKGHFAGMAQVVKRLLDIVQPDYLFMGQKDYQQQLIVGRLLELTGMDTALVTCPIVREEDGLAMSSRNVRLSAEERKKAATISATLRQAKADRGNYTLAQTQERAIECLNAVDGIRVVYFEIVDAKTLESLDNWEDAEQLIACTAVHLGSVRLIDNLFL